MRNSATIKHVEVVDPRIAEVLRQLAPVQRIAMVGAANRTVRRLLAAGVRFDHPDWEEGAVQTEVARRMLRGTT